MVSWLITAHRGKLWGDGPWGPGGLGAEILRSTCQQSLLLTPWPQDLVLSVWVWFRNQVPCLLLLTKQSLERSRCWSSPGKSALSVGTLSKGGARTQCPPHAVQSRPCVLREPSSWCWEELGAGKVWLRQRCAWAHPVTASPPWEALRSPRPAAELASRTVVLKGEGSTSMSLLARALGNGVPGPLGFKSLGVEPCRGIYQRLHVILPHKVLPVWEPSLQFTHTVRI